MKKVVRLKDRITGRIDTYPTLSELLAKNGEEALGISRAALYNAMHTGRGFWENKRVMVYYDYVDLGKNVWK